MTEKSLYKSGAGEKAIMAFYDTVLEHWPVPCQKININTRYGNTFAVVSGGPAAPVLILLHGASSNAASWAGDVGEYSRHFRVYAVDVPGDPGKSAPSRPAWNSPAYAEWLEDVINGLTADRVNLLGLSQGGWAAIKYAVYRPEKVSKLVLLSPAGVTADKASFLIRVILYSLAGRRGTEASIRRLMGDQKFPEEVLQYMRLIMTQFKPRFERLIPFTDEELKRLTMPVLLVGGKQDIIRDVDKIATRLRNIIPELTMKMYPDKGHVLANLAAEIVPFLRDI
jgi:pimeloyl-ACP methyl ester carboxylesterase